MGKIVFIGNIQWGVQSTGGGVQTKNQHFLRYILSRSSECKFFDTWGHSSIISLLKSLQLIICANKKTPIILSISTKGPYYIGKICGFLNLKRRVFYWVTGGDLAIDLAKKTIKQRKVYNFYEKIIVQCAYLKSDLEELGLNNCEVVPNFKPVIFTPSFNHQYGDNIRCVYFSRILKEKGVDDIIEVFKNNKHLNISVDFFGTLCTPYTVSFFEGLKDYKIYYKGFLDVSTAEGYELLSNYDILLFPTYFKGEGSPGTLLDSFIAGVPAIASSFHANSEVIIDGVNGILIPPMSVKSLSDAIKLLSSDEGLRKTIRDNAILSARKYEVNRVLGDAFQKFNIL